LIWFLGLVGGRGGIRGTTRTLVSLGILGGTGCHAEGVVGERRGCRVSIKEPIKCEKGDAGRRISRTRKIEKNS